MRLTAAAGLSVDVAPDGTVTIGLDGEDWFGPGRSSLPASLGQPVSTTDDLGAATSVTVVEGDVLCSVRAYAKRPLLVFSCEATTDLLGIATVGFDQPSVAWPSLTPADRNEHITPQGLRGLVFPPHWLQP